MIRRVDAQFEAESSLGGHVILLVLSCVGLLMPSSRTKFSALDMKMVLKLIQKCIENNDFMVILKTVFCERLY